MSVIANLDAQVSAVLIQPMAEQRTATREAAEQKRMRSAEYASPQAVAQPDSSLADSAREQSVLPVWLL